MQQPRRQRQSRTSEHHSFTSRSPIRMGDDDNIESMDIDHEEEEEVEVEEVEEKVDDEQKYDEKAPTSSPYVWSAFYDDEGTLYYYNSETQESAWEPPPNGEGFNPAPPPPVEEGQEEDDDHAAAAANTKKEAKAETTAEDKNDAAATATTEAPADTEAAATTVADDDDNNKKASAEEEVEEKVKTATAAASKWVRYKGDEGEYFYNAETDETQWEEPEEGFVDAEEEAQEQVEEAEVVSPYEQQQQQSTAAADNDQTQQKQNEEDVDTTMVNVGKNDDNDQELPSDEKIADETEMEEPESAVAAAVTAASSSSSKWVRYSGDDGDYYYNTDTQATQWEAPEEGFMEAEEHEASEAANVGASGEQGENQESATEGGGGDGEEPTTGAAAAAAAAAAASSWVRYKDDEGNDYYFNTETEASQWDIPEGFVESAAAATKAETAASASANEGDVPEKKASPGDQEKEPDDQEKEQQQKLDESMDEPTAGDDDDNDKREEEVQEEIDPAVKRLQEAENALNKPDSIFEPSCFDNVTEVVSSQGGNPQKALTALLDNYQGQTAICGLLARWLASLKSTTPNSSSDTTTNVALTVAGSSNASTSAAAAAGSSEAMAEEIRTTVQDVINRTAKQRFSKEAGDSILNLSRQKAAFLEDMMESTRWRKLLIDLSASHKDSAVLKYCLGSIADRGHHREIAKRINQADHFTVFRQMLQSELAAIGKVAVSAGTDPVTSIGMDELVNDLKRACTATSYTYLYSLQVLRALESKARKELQEQEEESDDPSNIRLRRAVRKWEFFCQILENSMVDPAASMAGSSTVFHKRRLDVALTINELTQRQRKRQRPRDDADTDNGRNGHDERGQSALETALLRFLRRYALGVQVDDSLLDPLLPSGLDTVNAGKQIGALLVKHSLSVRALLGYLYKPGATRVTAPVVKNKCARLIALAVRAAEEMAWAEYKAPTVKGGEDGELDNDDANSRELSDEVALTRVVLQGSQLCEQLESMVSFLVSVDKSQKDNNGSGIPPGPGQKLCTLAFQYAPVAQGVMMWAREFTHGNEFATSASFPTLSVSILSLARLVGINQPFARGDALAVALQFLRHTNRDVSYQKINAIKEQSLRLLIHLLMQGEVAAVLNAITSRLQQQSSSELDASLIRYFVAGVLEAVRPPVSCAFVRLFAQLLLSPLCIDAVRSTYFQAEHRTRLVQLVLAFPKVRALNGKKLEGEDLAVVNSLMATYQIKSE